MATRGPTSVMEQELASLRTQIEEQQESLSSLTENVTMLPSKPPGPNKSQRANLRTQMPQQNGGSQVSSMRPPNLGSQLMPSVRTWEVALTPNEGPGFTYKSCATA